ncbi:hypothetical protein GW17_00032747, partial [Ensete ventricosum]
EIRKALSMMRSIAVDLEKQEQYDKVKELEAAVLELLDTCFEKNDQLSCEARFAISTCTARYGRYIPVRQVTSTWTARYWAVLPKIHRRRPIEEEIDRQRSIEREIDRQRSIEEEKGKKKRKRRKKEEEKKEYLARVPSLPAGRSRPWLLFLPREETERIPARGERSRRQLLSSPLSSHTKERGGRLRREGREENRYLP